MCTKAEKTLKWDNTYVERGQCQNELEKTALPLKIVFHLLLVCMQTVNVQLPERLKYVDCFLETKNGKHTFKMHMIIM